MREWESNLPHMVGFGASGIGKSTLMQLATLRSLAKGDPVLVHHSGVNYLLRLNGSLWAITKNVDVQQVTAGNRAKDIVLCYDSSVGFADHFRSAVAFKKVLIVHSPLAHFANTGKTPGLRLRFIDNPTDDELIALAGLVAGVDAGEARKPIGLYGCSIRYVCDPALAEDQINQGLNSMVRNVLDNLTLRETTTTVHRLTV
jgi:hypothetical protein